MSDALTDINEAAAEEDAAHGRHRGHIAEQDAPEAPHGRHRRDAE